MVIPEEMMVEIRKHVKEGELFKLGWLKTKMSPAPSTRQLLADIRFPRNKYTMFRLREKLMVNSFDPGKVTEIHNNREYKKLEM